MDTLVKFFPYSFKEKKDVAALVINILVHIIVGFAVGVVGALLGFIPFVDFIIGIVVGAVDLYILIGIVLSVLDYLKVFNK